ncbi:uncharacterized protein TNCV_4600931 [Trichonephila clavipes]|nr:uncharacterized protein TNCV_4600931 [Trichonephila clavipes]
MRSYDIICILLSCQIAIPKDMQVGAPAECYNSSTLWVQRPERGKETHQYAGVVLFTAITANSVIRWVLLRSVTIPVLYGSNDPRGVGAPAECYNSSTLWVQRPERGKETHQYAGVVLFTAITANSVIRWVLLRSVTIPVLYGSNDPRGVKRRTTTRGLLATDHVILNHGQVTWTTPELAPPLLTTAPHQREDVSALDRFNVHRCPTRQVFSGIELELVTRSISKSLRVANHCDASIHSLNPAYWRRRSRDGRKGMCRTSRSASDEVHFWLNGYVNKQNCRIWSEANPQVYVETPLHPEKLTVWCALWAGGIIGSYFFKNDEGHNVTVNGDRYRARITNFFIPELNNHDVQELWFQQHGATCHTARVIIDLLKDTFGDRLISRFGPVNWPPRSCDLTPLDYFL